MKKSVLLFVIAIWAGNTNLSARTVTAQDAQTVAISFYRANAYLTTRTVTATLKYTRTETNGTVDFYVFDISQRGFVIVSGDDNMEPVLGYSTETNFDLNTAGKKGISYWMDQTAGKINAGIKQHVLADARISGLWIAYLQAQNTGVYPGNSKSNVVTPLLSTTWNQEPNYNQLCPFNTTDNQRAVTGCVACAMSQIMKFWNFPAHGTGSYSYTDAQPSFSNNYGTQSANFGTTTYNWTNMPASINGANSDIATLMYHCGVSVAMDYGDDNQGGSGAYVLQSEAGGNPSAQQSYSTYFGYNSATMQGVTQSSYSAANWITLLETELSAGRPIQYEGFGTAGGHTWVCDGFDANNMFHMNWGWGGYDNGYFLITNLNPNPYVFNTNDAALIGIQPLVPTACNVPATLTTTAVTTTLATFNWGAVTGAASYGVQYRKTGTTTWSTGTSTTNSFHATGLIASTTYEWQVKTVCTSGSSVFTASSTFTTAAAASCGVPASLTAISTSTTAETLSWGIVTGATKYNLQYKKTSAANWTIVSNITTHTYSLSGLTACTAYQFAVQSICASGTSAFGTSGSFTTGCASNYCASSGTSAYEYISKVTLGAINNQSGNNNGYGNFTALSTNLTGGSTVTIGLTPGFAGAPYHEYWTVYIDYNHNGSFTDPGEMVGQVNSTSAVSKTFTIPTTALNGNTRMRIQMGYGAYQTNPCAVYTYGEVEDYTVNITGNVHAGNVGGLEPSSDPIVEQQDVMKDIKLYPNPARDVVTVEYGSGTDGISRINIYNISGQKMMSYEKSSNTGFNAERINTNTLGNGVYIFELENNGEIRRQRFIVTK